ncbi:MAG: transposase [Pseudonocardia sp.]
MPRPRRWTDEQLAAAVAASRTLKEVCERLGLRPAKLRRAADAHPASGDRRLPPAAGDGGIAAHTATLE